MTDSSKEADLFGGLSAALNLAATVASVVEAAVTGAAKALVGRVAKGLEFAKESFDALTTPHPDFGDLAGTLGCGLN